MSQVEWPAGTGGADPADVESDPILEACPPYTAGNMLGADTSVCPRATHNPVHQFNSEAAFSRNHRRMAPWDRGLDRSIAPALSTSPAIQGC